MPKQGAGISVVVKNNNIELALKKFKNKIKKSGLMLLIAEKSYFEKPSMKKRIKKLRATARNKSNQEE